MRPACAIMWAVLHWQKPSLFNNRLIPAGQVWKSYYFAGSQRVAMREATSSGSTVYYFAADHLGSTSLTMDASGNSLSAMGYTPFGETRYGTLPTDRRFTGQREENGLGSLYDYGARFYSPRVGTLPQRGYDRAGWDESAAV